MGVWCGGGREGGRGEKLSVGLWDEIESVARVCGIYLHFFSPPDVCYHLPSHVAPCLCFFPHSLVCHCDSPLPPSSFIEGDVPPPPSSFVEGDVPPPPSSFIEGDVPPPPSSFIEGDVPPPPSSFIEGDVPPLLQISHQAVMSMCRAHKAVGDLGPTRELAVCLDPYSGLGLVLWILSG